MAKDLKHSGKRGFPSINPPQYRLTKKSTYGHVINSFFFFACCWQPQEHYITICRIGFRCTAFIYRTKRSLCPLTESHCTLKLLIVYWWVLLQNNEKKVGKIIYTKSGKEKYRGIDIITSKCLAGLSIYLLT